MARQRERGRASQYASEPELDGDADASQSVLLTCTLRLLSLAPSAKMSDGIAARLPPLDALGGRARAPPALARRSGRGLPPARGGLAPNQTASYLVTDFAREESERTSENDV